jgi:hypothetical protein
MKGKLAVAFVLMFVLVFSVVMPVMAMAARSQAIMLPPVQAEGMSLEQLLAAIFGLVVAVPGFALLISAIVNVLKVFKVVPDGAATMAFNITNVVVAVGLGVWAYFNPAILDKLPAVDSIAGALGNMLMVLITIFGASLLKEKAYESLKGLPVLGHSNSKAKGAG